MGTNQVMDPMLFSSYRRLEDSLAAERTAYISELSRQLVDRHNKMQDQLFQETRLYADLL